MKNKLLIMFAGIFLLALGATSRMYLYNTSGIIVNPGQVHSDRSDWESLGDFPSASAIAIPDVDARDYTSMAATDGVIIKEIKPGWNAIFIRCKGITDNQTNRFVIMQMRGDSDHYTFLAEITFTIGTQESDVATYEFADAVAENTIHWHKTSSTVSPGSEYIAEWSLDMLNIKSIAVFGLSGSMNCNCKLDISGV